MNELRLKNSREEIISTLKSLELSKGYITADEVVNEAEQETSPLHNYFEWDDTEAAKKYRLFQARMLINTVYVKWMGRETEGYWNVKVTVGTEQIRGYFPLEKIMSKQEMYLAVLDQALQELTYWQEKYRSLQDLKGVIKKPILDKAKSKLKLT